MTIFSKIIAREIPADIIYEDDLILAFRDINPVAPVHILVIPKKPIAALADVEASDEQVLGHMLIHTKKLAIMEGISESGYRVIINNGANAGQAVDHLHIHLIGGKSLGWPPYTDKMKEV